MQTTTHSLTLPSPPLPLSQLENCKGLELESIGPAMIQLVTRPPSLRIPVALPFPVDITYAGYGPWFKTTHSFSGQLVRHEAARLFDCILVDADDVSMIQSDCSHVSNLSTCLLSRCCRAAAAYQCWVVPMMCARDAV